MESFDITMLDRSPTHEPVADVKEDAMLDDAPTLDDSLPCEDDAMREDSPSDEDAAEGTPAPEPEEPSVMILRVWHFVLKSLETLPDSCPELIPRNLALLKEWLCEYNHFEVSLIVSFSLRVLMNGL
jgi:hypothetical protein